MDETLRDEMPSACSVDVTNRTWGSRVTSKTVGVTLAIAITKIIGLVRRVLSAYGDQLVKPGELRVKSSRPC